MPLKAWDRLPFRAALVVRVVALLALGAPVLWTRDTAGIVALAATAAVWLSAGVLEVRRRLPVTAITIGDAVLVGAICGGAVDKVPIALGAIAVPPFIAALYRGPWGVARSLSGEVVALVVVVYLLNREFTAEQGYSVFSWLVVGLGVGLVGCFVYSVLHEHRSSLTPYHYAQGLLRELIDISEGLDRGLNAVTLGGQLLWAVRKALPCTAVALYVPRGDGLTPLVVKTLGDDLTPLEDLAQRCLLLRHTISEPPSLALPLEAGSGLTAILVAQLTPGASSDLLSREFLTTLRRELQPTIVHLDTALLFASFRERASSEERRRLAREMHDGVAQEIASLGYLVDAIAGDATVERQRERIMVLRERITGIVAEIRRSLVNLRTNIGESESLGAAIAAIARSLSESSGMAIHITTDETTDRLRPEVETELFRIVQESINNALKHAHATQIDVHCQVRAPAAAITITDNGHGMGAAREDSYGLLIMRERAALVNGVLTLSESPEGGVQVAVTITGHGDQRPAETTVIGSSFDTATRVGP